MSTTDNMISVSLLSNDTSQSSVCGPTSFDYHDLHNEHVSLATASSAPSQPSTSNQSAIYNDSIDANYLLQKHQSFIDNHKSLNTDKLIEILGGPDAILQHYLSTNNSSTLNREQLQLIDILLTPTDNNHNQSHAPILILSPKNTFMHKCCKQRIADTIGRILFSKIMLFFLCILGLFILVNVIFYPNGIGQFWNTSHEIGFCMFFLCSFLVMLSLNRTATKFVINTFEFWFKMFYVIRYWICTWLYWWHEDKTLSIFNIAATAMVAIVVFLFCLLDALNVSLRSKIILLFIVSSLWSVWAYQWTLFAFSITYIVDIHFWNGHILHLEVLGLIASSFRIIAIFAWKQTFYTLFRSSKSTLIKKAVKIIWI